MAQARISKELADLGSQPVAGCEASLSGTDLFHWTAVFTGPPDSPYAGGTFFMNIAFPANYPSKPPRCNFTTRIYHTNINSNGAIYLDIIQDRWSPDLSIAKVLEKILQLLSNPNPDEHVVPDIAHLYKTDKLRYEANAREWTRKYAQ